jgi:hypothetical protein
LTHLVKAGRLSAQDRKSLKNLLETLNQPSKRQGKK